jgi:hypothetical protein
MTKGCWTVAALLCAVFPSVGAADDAARTPFSQALPDQALAAERGGAASGDDSQVWNVINVNGRADNISVNNSMTGDNSVLGGSFAGSRGFPTVIQNTGNGVLIQNATIINVTVKP